MADKGDLHRRDDDPEPEWLGAIVVVMLICVLAGGLLLFRYLYFT